MYGRCFVRMIDHFTSMPGMWLKCGFGSLFWDSMRMEEKGIINASTSTTRKQLAHVHKYYQV